MGLVNKLVSDPRYFGFTIDFAWFISLLLFIMMFWMPISLWLLFHGFALKKQMKIANYEGDFSIVNFAIAIPLLYWIIYIVSRIY